MHSCENRQLSALTPNPLNPRGVVIQDEGIIELATSIRAQGLIQPIIITPDNIIIAGHRRALAATVAGLSEVAVIVRDVAQGDQLEMMLVENIQRQDLTPTQYAQSLQKLSDGGMSLDEMSLSLGWSTQTLKKYLGILSLPTPLHDYYDSRRLALGTVKPLSWLTSSATQVDFAHLAISKNLTVNHLTVLVEKYIEAAKKPKEEAESKSAEREFFAKILEALQITRKRVMQRTDLWQVVDLLENAESIVTERMVRKPTIIKTASINK